MHTAAFTWIHFRQYVITGEPALITQAKHLMRVLAAMRQPAAGEGPATAAEELIPEQGDDSEEYASISGSTSAGDLAAAAAASGNGDANGHAGSAAAGRDSAADPSNPFMDLDPDNPFLSMIRPPPKRPPPPAPQAAHPRSTQQKPNPKPLKPRSRKPVGPDPLSGLDVLRSSRSVKEVSAEDQMLATEVPAVLRGGHCF